MRDNTPRQKRLFIVANRLPVSIKRRKKELTIQQSPGGLATSLRILQKTQKSHIIGWPGVWPTNEKEKKQIEEILKDQHQCYPVFLSPSDLEKYYYGFANKTLWPLFHYFPNHCSFEESEWAGYKRVNQKFFMKLARLSGPEDVFWIHDYHLMLLPSLIRKHYPHSAIGFFLHIPFPSSEIFRLLPWRNEILEGLLGADLIGFHTYEYARHFLSSVLRLLGHEHELGSLLVDNRVVKVENFPMGINFQSIEQLVAESSIRREITKLEQQTEAQRQKIVLSVDRLDYTKGIPQRLEGIESFLEKHSQWHGRFTYLMLSVPSRTKVRHYSLLKQEVDRMVGKINGRFGRPDWIPVHYMFRSLPFNKLLPLYAVADVALITSLRDGMNLVAKEYVAARKDNTGMLIISETAGAASELGEALTVNVNDKEDIAASLLQALEMSQKEQKSRMSVMRKRLCEYDIFHWTKSFVQEIETVKGLQAQHSRRKLNDELQVRLLGEYEKSQTRLLLLDYDGTLVSFAPTPERAEPDLWLRRILISLTKDIRNQVVVISGRDSTTLERWLGKVPCALVAEHGARIRPSLGQEWVEQRDFPSQWKENIKPIFKTYEARVPGSIVEEKEYGVAWHYRKANPELGQLRASELFDNMNEFLANTDLQVMHGNKVIEVRLGGINKGEATRYFLGQRKWDFILAVGDDWTDEDMFKVLPSTAYSITIGYKPTAAKFYLDSPQTCRNLLRKLSTK